MGQAAVRWILAETPRLIYELQSLAYHAPKRVPSHGPLKEWLRIQAKAPCTWFDMCSGRAAN